MSSIVCSVCLLQNVAALFFFSKSATTGWKKRLLLEDSVYLKFPYLPWLLVESPLDITHTFKKPFLKLLKSWNYKTNEF